MRYRVQDATIVSQPGLVEDAARALLGSGGNRVLDYPSCCLLRNYELICMIDYCFSVHELKSFLTWMLDYAYPLSPQSFAIHKRHIEHVCDYFHIELLHLS